MKNYKLRKGISLIVLIITIIVVIILAATVIITLSKNNPIESAKEASFKEDVRAFQNELYLYIGSETLKDYTASRENITMTEVPTKEEMNRYISSFKEKYVGKFGIENDELIYYPKNVKENEKKWLKDLGINPSGYLIITADKDLFEWEDENKTKLKGIKNQDDFDSYLANNNYILKLPDGCVKILKSAFFHQTNIKKIIMPDSITEVEQSVFNGCTSLNEVKLSQNLREIGHYMFFLCTSLEKIELPNSVEKLWAESFGGCSSLKYINLHENIKYLGEGCLEGTAISDIVIPESVTGINLYAFRSCLNLEKVEIKSNITSLPIHCFCSCSSLKEVKLPDSLGSISSEAFSECSSLKTIDIPDGVTSIGTNCFNGCKSLESVKLPSGLTKIKDATFSSCEKLGQINIPDNVTSIGASAFSGCKSLSEITIKNNVQTMGRGVFANDKNLVINCEASKKPDGWDENWNQDGPTTVNWRYTKN